MSESWPLSNTLVLFVILPLNSVADVKDKTTLGCSTPAKC